MAGEPFLEEHPLPCTQVQLLPCLAETVLQRYFLFIASEWELMPVHID